MKFQKGHHGGRPMGRLNKKTRAWRAVDSAPRDGTSLLLFVPSFPAGERVVRGHWAKSFGGVVPWVGWAIDGFMGAADYAPTHWILLPDEPVAEKQTELV